MTGCTAEILQYLQIACKTLQIFCGLKGHNQLCGCADLDTSFSHFENVNQSSSRNLLHFSQCFFLDFQSFDEKSVLSVLLLILWYYFYHIWLKKYLSCLGYMQISYGMVCNGHVRQLTVPLSSDDVNSCIAQHSSVVLFPQWLIMLFARLRIYPNFTARQPRANYVISMPLLSRHHERYACWKRLQNGQYMLPLVDLSPSSAKTRVDALTITLPTEKQNIWRSVSVQDTLQNFDRGPFWLRQDLFYRIVTLG